jgi:hypothetical protein
VAGIEEYWKSPELLLPVSVKTNGTQTSTQLQRLFRKCVTPGAEINFGWLGGSISIGRNFYWPRRLATLLSAMCPSASVATFDGARSGTGSFTPGACANSSMGAISRDEGLDLFISEVSLNDR